MLVFFGMVGNSIIAFGVFLPVMVEEFGWSRATLSGAYTAYWATLGLMGPLVGLSVSKFGSRKNIIAGNAAMALGLLGMSFVSEVWQVYLVFGILVGAGQAFGTFIPCTTIVTNWFTRRRSLAIGMLSAAGGVGGLVMSPIISWLLSSLGLQLSWVCLAGSHTVLAVIVAGILTRNRPEDLGQLPEGERIAVAHETDTANPRRRRVYHTPVDWKAGDAIRTRALWLIVVITAAHLFSLNFITLHQVAYLQDIGFSHLIASTTVGVMAGIGVAGQLGSGVLGTRFEGRYLAAISLAGFAIGLVILMNARTLPLVYLHTVLSGIGYGGLLVLSPVLIGAYFGRTHYAQIMGWTVPITTIFSAASPALAGIIFDITGSYTPAFIIAISFLGVALVCAFLARPPRPPASAH
jgi:MFS family permease